MKTLTTWFEVVDCFGGSPNPNDDYETALKKAEAKGVSFSKEIWNEALQILGEEGIDLSYAE